MNWLVKTLTTSVGQKVLMALTGLALCGFLVVHLGGNLLLYADSDGTKFNAYAEAIHKQGESGLLIVAELGLIGLFGLHIFLAVSTSLKNRRARGTRYAVKTPKKPKGWLVFDPSYMMTLTGIVIFLFLCLHISDLRLGTMGAEGNNRLVLSEIAGKEKATTVDQVKEVLSDPLSGPVYLIGAVLLAIHVSHGFSSAFQSLGFDHPKYTSLVRCVSVLFALVVGFGFASFPIWAMLTQQ